MHFDQLWSQTGKRQLSCLSMNQPQEKERARYRYVHDYVPCIRSWYICYSPDRRSVLGKTVPKAVGLSRTQDTGHSFSQYGPTLAGEQHFYSFLKPNKWLQKEPDPLWVGRMGRILPALGTNQIAGFVEYHLLMHWEKIELDICQVIIIIFLFFLFLHLFFVQWDLVSFHKSTRKYPATLTAQAW